MNTAINLPRTDRRSAERRAVLGIAAILLRPVSMRDRRNYERRSGFDRRS